MKRLVGLVCALALVLVGAWLARGGESVEIVSEVPGPGRPVAAEFSDGTPFWLVDTGDEVVAVEALTPSIDRGVGLPEVVSWCEPAGQFADTWYGWYWDEGGAHAKGPPADLATYEASESAHEVRVYPDRRGDAIDAATDGGRAGASCVVASQPTNGDAETDPGSGWVLTLHPMAEEDPRPLQSARDAHEWTVVEGTLIGDPGSYLSFCDGALLEQADEPCPTDLVPTDHTDLLEDRVVHVGRFAVREDAGVIIDLWMLPGVVTHWES